MRKKRNFKPLLYLLGFVILALIALYLYVMVSQP
jgi:hypothetical protein